MKISFRISLLLGVFWLGCVPLQAADAIDYFQPARLAGTIYDSDTNKVLFTFLRTATRAGSTIRVLREYNHPDGSLAARERVVYDGDKLVSYELEDLQSGTKGSARIEADPQSVPDQKLVFHFKRDKQSPAKTNSERPEPDTLINDMIAPFLLAHWDELMRGSPVKFRFISVVRAETVGLKVVKESETTVDGKSVVILRMEPSSFIIAQFVAPLLFTVEKNPPHHVIEYSGRTTPSIQRNGKWVDLDARTVFDWK